MGVIFVGGVHGVGKGTLCHQFAERTGLPWFTASALIKTEKQSAIAVDTKAVTDSVGNQDLLLRSVRHLLMAHPTILLDGHFTVLNSDNCIVPINVEVFDHLELQGIVVLQDVPSSICERLRQRDHDEWSVSEVTSFQSEEVSHAQMVAAMLGIPVQLIDASDSTGFAKAVETMLR